MPNISEHGRPRSRLSLAYPAGRRVYSSGSHCTINGRVHHKYTGSQASCVPCAHRHRCLRYLEHTKVRQEAIFQMNQPSPHEATQRIKQAIDSPRGRQLAASALPQWSRCLPTSDTTSG